MVRENKGRRTRRGTWIRLSWWVVVAGRRKSQGIPLSPHRGSRAAGFKKGEEESINNNTKVQVCHSFAMTFLCRKVGNDFQVGKENTVIMRKRTC